MTGYVLTPRAEDSLTDIFAWTLRTFGLRQAERYVDEVLRRCDGLAAGRVPSRSCADAFAPGLGRSLRFALCGKHYIVFVTGPSGPVVIDFIHQSADITAKLEALE